MTLQKSFKRSRSELSNAKKFTYGHSTKQVVICYIYLHSWAEYFLVGLDRSFQLEHTTDFAGYRSVHVTTFAAEAAQKFA